MRPAFSVIFLTTLTGAAQGLFVALYLVDLLGAAGIWSRPDNSFFVIGALLTLVLAGLGLIASFFHLGHPERAWRAIAMWRTSWLSRECLCLPLFMALVFAWGLAHWFGSSAALALGALGCVVCATLFFCTSMIYACLRFLREWASPLTLINFTFLGGASGFTLASALSAWIVPTLAHDLAIGAALLTLAGCVSRSLALRRNARLVPKSTLQSATGIRSERIVQKSRGFTGGAFNTKEFFHGQTQETLRCVKWGFLAAGFALPLLFIVIGLAAMPAAAAMLFSAAFCIQYLGLLAERWFFFAEAQHPQNIYYQGVS